MALKKECSSCFTWKIIINGEEDDTDNWNVLNLEENDQISMLINHDKITNEFIITLDFQGIRTENGGHCFDPVVASQHIFQPGDTWRFQLEIGNRVKY